MGDLEVDLDLLAGTALFDAWERKRLLASVQAVQAVDSRQGRVDADGALTRAIAEGSS